MAEEENLDKYEGLEESAEVRRESLFDEEGTSPLLQATWVDFLSRCWADFHLFVTSPSLESLSPPRIIEPEGVEETGEQEFVYPILDFGDGFSISKGEDMFLSGQSMCKFYYTIEKIIYVLVNRLEEHGIEKDEEVQVSFGGHEIAQRKAFEVIINLGEENIVVNNFEPGSWGERYLETVKNMSEKFGFPPQAPRTTFKAPGSSAKSPTK